MVRLRCNATVAMEPAARPLQRLYHWAVELQRDESPPWWTGKLFNNELVFRPKPFYIQGALIGALLVFLVFAMIGRLRNRWRVRAWHHTYAKALESEFAQVGAEPGHAVPPLVWNGADEACLYATGRRGVSTLHATLSLRPRHDPLLWTVQHLYDIFALPAVPWCGPDRLTLTLTLPSTPRINGATFAIIDKTELRAMRHDRFDMKFARVLDSENASELRGLDARFAIASESGDATDRWLGDMGPRGDKQRARLGVAERLHGPGGRFFVSLLYTDQPAREPTSGAVPESERIERLELTMRVPRTASEASASLPLLALVLDIADALAQTSAGRSDILQLRPETYTSLKKTRAQVGQELTERHAREDRAEAAGAEEEERRRAQQEKFEKLTPAEQARRKDLAKRRAQRKAQMTQAKRS